MTSRLVLLAASASVVVVDAPAFSNSERHQPQPRPLSGDPFANTFFGEDVNTNPGEVEIPRSQRVNANAAQADFLAAVGGFLAKESFEGFDEGHDFSSESMFLPFENKSTGANIDRGRVRETPGGMANDDGRYSTDGDQYLSANTILNGSFRIEFVDPQDAFGFFGVDVGDWDGQLTLTFELVGGGEQIVDVPHLLGEEGEDSGSVFFWGFVDEKNLFSAVTFSGSGDDRDVFAFDELQVRGTIIPLPTPVALAAGGLAPLLLRRRRRDL